jgi:hypothetical protein
MKYFFVKLVVPRPDFRTTMTEAEGQIMGAHQAFMAECAERGFAIAYGPVADPAGDFGAGFWAVPDDVDLQAVVENDPAIKAQAGFSREIYPMPALVYGKARQAQSA